MLIIPDIHGRSFWKDAVAQVDSNEQIIFLGDYLDPYIHEFKNLPEFSGVDNIVDVMYTRTVDNFKDIIKFKKDNFDRVILLLGNHDCTYAVSPGVCNCRADRKNYKELCELFNLNKDLFQLAYYKKINDKDYVFSHAGMHRKYVKYCFGDNAFTPEEAVNAFNNWFNTIDKRVLQCLGFCSYYRGGVESYGSIVWADMHEWVNEFNKQEGEYEAYQVFGHTQMIDDPFVTETFANLDCRRAFKLNDDGVFTEMYGAPVKVLH